MTCEFNKNTLNKNLFYLLSFWAFTGLFLYKEADKTFAAICLVVSLLSLINSSPKEILNNIFNRKLSWVFISASLIAITSKLSIGYSSSELRVLITLSLCYILTPNSSILLLKRTLPHISFLGCLISIIYCSYETFYLNTPRSNWAINPIPYTTFTASVSAICLWHLINYKPAIIKLISGLGYSFGLIAIIISQTRGSLLAIIIASLYLLLSSNISTKKMLLYLLTITFIASVFNMGKLSQRYDKTIFEVESLINGDYSTSIGIRLDMWKTGYVLFKEKPTFFGLGNSHSKEKEKLYKSGLISEQSTNRGHYHNQYISSLIKNGVVGLSIILLLMIIPLLYFINETDKERELVLLILIIYSVSALTDIPFSKPPSLAFYGIIMLIITSTYKGRYD
ncbi:O-antigen ligase family protein [Vibrio coralliirubri]|uniref:O-antigen ligase family protein n=1 Tax=Vibrio coralliirubri TaxID=1516159 RepID=UPI002FE190CB